MTSDAEVVRDTLASVTGAPFEIVQPGPSRLLLQRKARWFVACVDLAHVEKTAYLDRAWRDKEGLIWFETSEIADMIQLVERLYGEEGAAKMPEPEIGVPPQQSIPKEVSDFPRVVELLKQYESVVTQIGKWNGVGLRLLYDGGAGVTTVRIAIPTTSFDEYSPTQTRYVVEHVSRALKEAYEWVLDAKA